MGKFQRFTELEVWEYSKTLASDIYRKTSEGPFNRDWSLRDQMRKAAVSIPSNIAEGFERGGTGEFINFLSIAKGSNGELITQLYIAYDIGYLSKEDYENLVQRAQKIGKMLGGFMKYLKKSGIKGTKYR
jgi:four helix bundle protein